MIYVRSHPDVSLNRSRSVIVQKLMGTVLSLGLATAKEWPSCGEWRGVICDWRTDYSSGYNKSFSLQILKNMCINLSWTFKEIHVWRCRPVCNSPAADRTVLLWPGSNSRAGFTSQSSSSWRFIGLQNFYSTTIGLLGQAGWCCDTRWHEGLPGARTLTAKLNTRLTLHHRETVRTC